MIKEILIQLVEEKEKGCKTCSCQQFDYCQGYIEAIETISRLLYYEEKELNNNYEMPKKNKNL